MQRMFRPSQPSKPNSSENHQQHRVERQLYENTKTSLESWKSKLNYFLRKGLKLTSTDSNTIEVQELIEQIDQQLKLVSQLHRELANAYPCPLAKKTRAKLDSLVETGKGLGASAEPYCLAVSEHLRSLKKTKPPFFIQPTYKFTPPETLTQKIEKFLVLPNIEVLYRFDLKRTARSYDQDSMIKKINELLKLLGKDPLSEIGHCNGLSLAWLAFISIGKEDLFYKMVQLIVDQTLVQLIKVSNLIEAFIEMFTYAQDPEILSQGRYLQHHLDKIIGDTLSLQIDNSKGYLTEAKLIAQLTLRNLNGNMITITGWADGSFKGHTVGLYYRKPCAYLFDTNTPSGKPLILAQNKPQDIASAAIRMLFRNKRLCTDAIFDFCVVCRPVAESKLTPSPTPFKP